MNNMTTKEFCKKFGPFPDDEEFILKFDNMKECYQALLTNKLDEDFAIDLMSWIISREEIISKSALIKFFALSANRVRYQIFDPNDPVINIIDSALKFNEGKITENELLKTVEGCETDMIENLENISEHDVEYKLQFEELRKIGNPFKNY